MQVSRQLFTRGSIFTRLLALGALAFMAVPPASVHAAVVQRQVGTGTSASCTNAAWQAAFAPGAVVSGNSLLITFNCGASPVTISVAPPDMCPLYCGTTYIPPITVDGGTPGLITLSASGGRILDLQSIEDITLKNLTFINGRGSNCSSQNCGGGAIRNSGRLSIVNCVFSGNSVTSSLLYQTDGGAILNFGDLSVTNSSFSGNSASKGSGGAIYSRLNSPANLGSLNVSGSSFSGNVSTLGGPGGGDGGGFGGAIASNGTMTVVGSSFSGNSADHSGGGIYTYANIWGATTAVTNTTFSGNLAKDGHGGGLYSSVTVTVAGSTFTGNSATLGTGGGIRSGGLGTMTLKNTIVANNTPGGNCSTGAGGALLGSDGGGNLVWGDATCHGINADPALGPLTGSSLPYHPLGADSAAINLGNPATCWAAVGAPIFGLGGRDQRGLSRRVGACDSGAYEAVPASLALFAGSNQSAAINTAFGAILQAKVLDAAGNGLGGVVVTFAGPASGAGIAGGGVGPSGTGGIAYFAATANGTTGAYPVAAGATGLIPVDFALTNSPPPHGVVYNGNASTGGAVPADGNAYAAGVTVTVLGNNGNLVKTGFVFAGWNTAANGSGAGYAGGANFAMGSGDVTLYAQWGGPGCTLDVDGNGSIDALSDGLMIMRAMFGLTGTAVTSGAIGDGTPSRATWPDIRAFMNLSCGASFAQ